jgi:hypothetical protein
MGVFTGVNLVAVIVAAVTYFIIGAVWYSPILFGNEWLKEMKIKPTGMKKDRMALCMGGSFASELLTAFVLAAVVRVSNADGLVPGANAGFLLGVGLLATSIITNYLYEDRSLKLYAINAGYHVASFTAMGAILGAWQ